jgi:hypothetical protein
MGWSRPADRGATSTSSIKDMAKKKSTTSSANGSTANLGFEAKLWLAADKLRNNMDAAEYKHVVLGLIFLKYVSDTFEEHHAKLIEGKGEFAGANPEDKDEYLAARSFGCRRRRRGRGCNHARSCPPSARTSMTRWLRSSAITRA